MFILGLNTSRICRLRLYWILDTSDILRLLGITRSGYYRWLRRRENKTERQETKETLKMLVKNYHFIQHIKHLEKWESTQERVEKRLEDQKEYPINSQI